MSKFLIKKEGILFANINSLHNFDKNLFMAKEQMLASVPTLKKTKSLRQKKEPELYIFKLCQEHPKYYEGAKNFPPFFRIPNVDTILWNYGTESEPDIQPREIRYIDGLKTIFVDEQEANGPLPDSVLSKQTNDISFENGHCRVESWNKPKIQFMTLSNLCDKNVNKFKRINNVYTLLEYGNNDDNVVELGKKKDRAYDIARSCSEEDMIPHAKFLGIPFIYIDTNEERSMEAIREDYKAKALENPEKFLLHASNPKLKTRYIIEQGIERGIVTTGLVKNQAHWAATKQLITSLPGNETPLDALTEYASTSEGESFISTLKVQL